MKLEQPIINIQYCPDDLFQYLIDTFVSDDWNDEDLLTQEEAFFHQSYRREAVTKYFNEQSFYYSKLPPSTALTEKIKPYTDYLLTTVFPNYSIFRCQVVCLHPGQNVFPHIDPRFYHRYGKRIHLPLVINDGSYHVHFDPNDNYKINLSKMTAKMITDFDNITPHSAFNYGTGNRIHIICDIVQNDVIEQLEQRLNGNPNATDPKTVEEYYFHLKNIETRYNCKYQDLKPYYLEAVNSL